MAGGSFQHGTAAGVRRRCPCVRCAAFQEQQRAARAGRPAPVRADGGTDTDMRDWTPPAAAPPPRGLPTDFRRAAQLAVCQHARDHDDARLLLDALGLLGKESA